MLKVDQMFILHCKACGTFYIPPKYLCSRCGHEHLHEYMASGLGKIYTYTTIFVAPESFKDQVPYTIAVVELNEGLKVTARVYKVGKSPIKIGYPVRFLKKDEVGYWFNVAESYGSK